MQKIDEAILVIDKKICTNIDKFDASERGILSQNILSDLRDLVEHTSLKAFSNGTDIEITYDNIKKANNYVKSRSILNFLNKFHKQLQISTSHFTQTEGGAERLMLKYYEYLLRIKDFLQKNYNLSILLNINQFPINSDPNLQVYYEKISQIIDRKHDEGYFSDYNDRYYIQKVKPFFVNQNIYYEVTFTTANERVSKFDRIIAFTNIDIICNYAVKLWIKNANIDILGKTMHIHLIENFEVSIRPCEFNNFAQIFNMNTNIATIQAGYRTLMRFISETRMNLIELLDSSDTYYNLIKTKVLEKSRSNEIFDILDNCRHVTKADLPGCNILRYLLYGLNNKIIKNQLSNRPCHRLSSLYLDYGCIPFDDMPFTSSLKQHNPKLSTVFDCLDVTGREHEMLARLIKNNTEKNGQLYTSKKDIVGFENIDTLIDKYNEKLYIGHPNRRIDEYDENIYIRGYDDDTAEIIKKLKEFALSGIEGYSRSVNFWLQNASYQIDCPEKKEALRIMFENSNIALIYGAAGTGKTTIIDHISNFFNDENKIYLANTNPAVDNLKQKVHSSNSNHYTIRKFLSPSNNHIDCDILIIDECSTVSNSDMRLVLNTATFKLLVLVGDVFQIESIIFGNWFSIARSFISKASVFELEKPYRSKNENLLTVWDKVRNIDDNILEHMSRSNYSIALDETIFNSTDADEIILCLNYDGLYGINNINKFFQCSNPELPVQWGVQTYKVGDPILFNESNRFHPLIYNNSKGILVNIQAFEREIQFEIQLDKPINQLQASVYDFELINQPNSLKSIIRFTVNKYKSTDHDDDSADTIVPFQVAYAVSIHKAQGLEFKSVKIVITDEYDELVTHNIFYTAITRAREKLKIYWSPETEKKVLNSFNKKKLGRDVALISTKNDLKIVR